MGPQTRKRKAEQNHQKAPTKRQREPNTTTKPKKSIQWINPALNLIQNVAGHPKKNALSQYAHSPLLQLPLQPGILTPDTIHRHFEAPGWITTYPVPLITHRNSPESGRGKFIDPILRLVKAKKYHSSTMQRLKSTYLRKKAMVRKICKGRAESLYPSVAFKVAEQMERDPDRWFSEQLGYDYYYSGGNMATVDGEKFRRIINTVGEKMDVIEMVPFEVDGSRLNMEYNQLQRHELGKEHGPVFEVRWSETEKACEDKSSVDLNVPPDACLMVALRRKHAIEVLLTTCGHESLKTKTITSEVPFITCCFPQGRGDSLLCTSDLDKKLKIWNYSSNKMLDELKLKKADGTDDCWTCVRPIRTNFLVCLDRTTIKLFKTKVNLALVLETPLSMWLWSCERASCMEVCTETGFLFIGTTHKLLVVRLVDSPDSGPPEFQQIITFTHNLKHFPTMVKYGSDSNQTYYVWISSQLPGDTTICNFSKLPPKRFATHNLPQKPSTIHESFHLARIKGKCIYPASALKHRLHLFHSGLAVLVDSDRIHLLLQTSFGDIFHQQVLDEPDEMPNANEIPALYHSWMLKLNNEKSKPLATDFKNFHGFKKILTCTNLDPPVVPVQPDSPYRKRPRWRQTVEQLHQYKDLLAPGMLSIWGYRPDVTNQKQQQQTRRLSTDVPMDVTDRVANWLDTTAINVTVNNKEREEVMEQTTIIDIPTDHEDLFHSKVEIVEDVIAPTVAGDTDVTCFGPVSSSGLVGKKAKDATRPNRRKYVQGF